MQICDLQIKLFSILQFLHPFFNEIRRADAVDLVKEIGEVLAGSDAAFFRQGFYIIEKVFPVLEQQVCDVMNPQLAQVFVEIDAFVLIDYL